VLASSWKTTSRTLEVLFDIIPANFSADMTIRNPDEPRSIPSVWQGTLRYRFRNVEPRIFLLQLFVIIYSLTAAAFRTNPPSISADPLGPVRLAIPAIVAACGLLLRDVFNDHQNRQPHDTALDVMLAVVLVIVSELILSVLEPKLILQWAPTQGGFVGIWLLVGCRSLFAHSTDAAPQVRRALSVDEIQLKVHEVESTTSRIARFYFVVGAILSTIGSYVLVRGSAKAQLAASVLLVGSVYQIWHLIESRSMKSAPVEGVIPKSLAGYQWQLNRQQLFLQHAGLWCYGALLPASFIFLFGQPVYPYWIPLVILIAAEANHREIQRLRWRSAALQQ
jgi:hypothetical protein